MNPLPILALAAVAGTYSVVTYKLEQDFASPSHVQSVSNPMSDTADVSVYSLVERVAPAMDTARCEAQAQMDTILTVDFEEQPIEKRIVGDGLHVELWGSTEMGTWTLVHDGNDGVACVISSGIGWTDESSPDQIFMNAPLAS